MLRNNSKEFRLLFINFISKNRTDLFSYKYIPKYYASAENIYPKLGEFEAILGD